ncbi:MAG TPA: M28 family peptidase [Candidatus Polarisedimenticolaceae bacterium]|nr:M28 family peptidase [Candidatus Polarisedimenticolaceae bacterium]
MRSLLRIVLAVVCVLGAAWIALAWSLRQPTFGREEFPGNDHAESARLESHVRYLAAPDHPRDWRHPEELTRAAAYIESALKETGASVSRQPYRAGGREMSNVVAAFGPAGDPSVVVGAHYDVCGPFPGADDNASGIAGLLEVGRLLGRTPPRAPVVLVAYSTEEPPYFGGDEMGSAVHAASLARSGARPRAMISLEMIGLYTDTQPSAGSLLHLLYPSDGDFVALAGRFSDRDLVRRAKRCFRGATDVRAVSYSGPTGPGIDLSDQRNYWAQGYPAFMVTDTGPIRNLHYHTATDTADSLDYRRMAGVVDGVYSSVIHIADSP